MNKSLKILYSFFILTILYQVLLVGNNKLCAQLKQKTQIETTIAPVPVYKIEKYRTDNDFKYIKQAPAIDFTGILLKWLSDFLEIVFSNNGPAPYIRYAVIILVILFAVSKIVGGDFVGVFRKNNKYNNNNGLSFGIDDINNIDFEKEIENASKQQNFRLATRFLYLKLLNALNEIEYINWQPGKTNTSYRTELSKTNISDNFNKLSGLYEFSWYGNFELNKSEFELLSKDYKDIFISLNNKR